MRPRARSRRNGLSGGAWSGIPFGTVGLLLELRTRDKRLLEVLRIVDDGGHKQRLAAAGERRNIEVFGEGGVLAVRDAVLSQISGAQAGSCDFQRRALPLRGGNTLPGPFHAGHRRIEMEEARLHAGVAFDS